MSGSVPIVESLRHWWQGATLRGLNFEEGATAKERNKQIGGHKA